MENYIIGIIVLYAFVVIISTVGYKLTIDYIEPDNKPKWLKVLKEAAIIWLCIGGVIGIFYLIFETFFLKN